MKYLLLGLAIAAALLGGVVFSGGEANAGGETRLRAFLPGPVLDPFGLSVADFRQRSDRTRFSTEVHNVAHDGDFVIGTVRVTSAVSGLILLEEKITIALGIGHLERDSRLGHIVQEMAAGDTVEVWNGNPPVGPPIRTGTLNHK